MENICQICESLEISWDNKWTIVKPLSLEKRFLSPRQAWDKGLTIVPLSSQDISKLSYI